MNDGFEIDLSAEWERQLARCDTVRAYKIPRASQGEGLRCADWYNNWIWTGRARVLLRGSVARVVLDDPSTGLIFAEAPLEDQRSLQEVLDSACYFGLRIASGTREAFIGIGFADRNEAWEFKAALRDAKRGIQDFEASRNAYRLPILSTATDYPLRAQTIRLNRDIPVRRRRVPQDGFQLA
jgi:hypothetical protein